MEAIRRQLVQHFTLPRSRRDPETEVADASYILLRFVEDIAVVVDGWQNFHIVQESHDSLDAVGLMTLLPGGSTPIALGFKSTDRGVAWSVKFAHPRHPWNSLSESKKWKSMYLYATGESVDCPWLWEWQHEGISVRADA